MNVRNDSRDEGTGGIQGAAGDEPPRPTAARRAQAVPADQRACGQEAGDQGAGDQVTGEGRSATGLEIEVLRDVSYWDKLGSVDDLIAAVARVIAQPVTRQNNQQIPGDGQRNVSLLVEPCAAIVMLSDDARVQKLNLQFRGIDKPTNVLSFPYTQSGPLDAEAFDGAQATNLGDIVLAAQTVMREANEQQKPPAHHFQHLVLHGLLHLMGFDHETLSEAREMEAIETELLARLGIADPYAEAPNTTRQPDSLSPTGAADLGDIDQTNGAK